MFLALRSVSSKYVRDYFAARWRRIGHAEGDLGRLDAVSVNRRLHDSAQDFRAITVENGRSGH